MPADPPTLTHLEPPVAAFLDAFRAASRSVDVSVLRGCFSNTFLAGDVNGATPVTREAFLQALPARANAAERAGVGPAQLLDASATVLDDRWTLLGTRWAAPLRSGGSLVMSSTFLLHDDHGVVRVHVYVNHQGLPTHLAVPETL